jgi:Na+-transporting NADH:ubiquinone oxidoreductase subunit C
MMRRLPGPLETTMHPSRRRLWIVPAALVVAGPLPAAAASFLTIAEAQQALLPGEALAALAVDLDAAQAKAVTERSGVRARPQKLRVWRTPAGALFFVDEVLGKHEFITYALAVDPEGKVLGVEILDYRETYGGEIRDPAWRRQFAGKTSAAPFRLDDDVRNISGATLSCRHVTDGVKRLLATRDVILPAITP